METKTVTFSLNKLESSLRKNILCLVEMAVAKKKTKMRKKSLRW